MTFPTHVLFGAIIGKMAGDYTTAILSSTLIDIDHLHSYASHGLLLKPKKLWETLIDQKDSYGDQRGFLHNVFIWLSFSFVLFYIFDKVGLVIAIGWLGHLCLDALDKSDYFPFYPNTKINLRGPIQYGTYQELALFLFLIVVYFFI